MHAPHVRTDLVQGGSVIEAALVGQFVAVPEQDHRDPPPQPMPSPAPHQAGTSITAASASNAPLPPPLTSRPDLLQAIADRRGFGFADIEARAHPEELLDPIRAALKDARPDPEADRSDLEQLVAAEARLTAKILTDGFDLWTRFTREYRKELKTQPPGDTDARAIAERCRGLLTGPDHSAAHLVAELNPTVPRGVRARLCRWIYSQDDARPDWITASDEIEALRGRVVLRNMSFAARGAKMAYASGLSWRERTLAGVLGLMRALDTWEPDGTGNFQTYARHWLKARVHRMSLEHGHPARRSNWLSEQAMRVQQHVDENARTVPPTDWTIDRVRRIAEEAGEERGAVARSLLPWWGDDDDPERLDDLLGPFELTTGAIREAETDWSRMDAALRQLEQQSGARRRHIIEHRFGLTGDRQQTLSEIGVDLEITRQRVSQIEREALVALRHLLGLPLAYPPEASTSPTSSDSPSTSS